MSESYFGANGVILNFRKLSRIFLLLFCVNCCFVGSVSAYENPIKVLFDASCSTPIKIIPTNPTSCAGTGNINVTMSNDYRIRYRLLPSGTATAWTTGNVNYTGLIAGQYRVEVENISPNTLCRDFVVTLFYTETNLFTSSSVGNATSCNSSNGTITLNTLAAGTEISWLTNLTRTWVPKSSLSGGSNNMITGLAPGQYVILVRRSTSIYCYQTATVTVGPTNCESTGLCGSTLGTNRFPNGDFGSGAGVQGSPLSSTETNYFYTTMQCDQPDDGQYSIINTTDCNGSSSGGGIFGGAFDVLTQDHTTGDVGGYMMLVNASYTPDIAFQKEITGLCPNTEYQFSAWIYNIQPGAGIKPNLTFVIDGIGRFTTGNITATGWQNVGFRFKTGNGTTSIFSIRNNNTGGSGNDWLIDDIFVGICEPSVSIATVNTCVGTSGAVASATITDVQLQFSWYKWQYSDNSGSSWSDATTAAQATFSGTSYTVNYALPSPIPNNIAGRVYRINVATSSSNLGTSLCSALSSNALTISNLNAGSIAADQTICAGGDPAQFTSVAASGTGTLTYQWQTSTTSLISGFGSIGVSTPAYDPPGGLNQTTYYRRAVTSSSGGCTAFTQPVTVEVNTVTPGTITASQTICTGGIPQQISGTN